jgi:DNA-binding transcriptional ArsR family regulator
MARRGLVTVTKREGFSRFFPEGEIGADKQRILSCLRQEIPRGVVLYLLRHPGATHGELLENFTISGGTLSYHIKKLVSKGVVKVEKKGRESHMTVLDPERVTDLLIVYRRTFLDTLVDEFVSRYVMSRSAHRTTPKLNADGQAGSDKDDQ